jgi:hypothetical protein
MQRKAVTKVWLKKAAAHFAMGAGLGTVAALALVIGNTGALGDLLAAGSPSGISIAEFVGAFAGMIAVGATLTGVIFSAMEEG